jgi:hypothetical protein
VARDKASFLLAMLISELRLDNLTKTDDILLALGKTFAAYMKSVFPFQYKNKIYRLINNYVASPYTRCDVCGNHPIIEVSVIRSEDGQQLRVGNDCIDCITNRRVSRWFKNYRRKRENVIKNRKYIDGLSLILNAYRRNELAFQITDCDIEKLSMVLERMINGLNPNRREEQIAECYISRKAKA